MNNIKVCQICGFSTENGRVMSNHKRWQHKTDKQSEEYASYLKKIRKPQNKKETVLINCKECGKLFETEKTISVKTGKETYKHQFCSMTCSARQGSKFVDYEKVSEWAKANPRGAYSAEWRASHPEWHLKSNHSKREQEIVSFFKENFPNDEWRVGFIDGSKKHDGCILDVDLWSPKLKVIIEYDGIWYFKDIHNQLERKQKVDSVLMNFCKENDFRIIRIDEQLNISLEEVSKAVYDSKKPVELFGSKRYNYLGY